jgi:ferritin
MLISEKLSQAMNEQVGRELGASNQYVNIAAYFDSESLPQMAAFFYRQADEERMHAMKFVHYIADAGGKVAVPAVSAARADLASAETALALSLEWEMEVTRQISTLMDLAIKESDHIAQEFLRWFVTEQLEEVSTMDELLSVIRRAGSGGLLFVEDYLARRPEPHSQGEAS